MTTHRRLKYSVSDASRRMYREETNGIYRKLENPSPTENQLRHQRFEARQRPLSHILASSSFRDTLSSGQVSGGQSLSNLKKARLRNSLNLPINFSLDSEYFVNANDDLNSSGTLRDKPKLEKSAFSYVPEKDIISLGDLDSPCAEICGTSDKLSSVGSKKSVQNSRKSSTSSSHHTSSSSESTGNKEYKIEDIEREIGTVSKSESDCSKSFESRKALQKRHSFKEVFPEPVNKEFLEKNNAEIVERKSFSSLQQDANHIFDSEISIQDMCTAESGPFSNTSLNRSLSSESGGSCSPKNATQVFDSNDHFQPMGDVILVGGVEIPEARDLVHSCRESRYTGVQQVSPTRNGPLKAMNFLPVRSSQNQMEIENDIDIVPQTYKDTESESQIKLDRTLSVESVPPPLPLSKIPDVIENISLDSYVGHDCDSLTPFPGPADSPKSVEPSIKMDSGRFVRADENPNFPGTAITYYGPIYASNNTLILPQQSDPSPRNTSGKLDTPQQSSPSPRDNSGKEGTESDSDSTSTSSTSTLPKHERTTEFENHPKPDSRYFAEKQKDNSIEDETLRKLGLTDDLETPYRFVSVNESDSVKRNVLVGSDHKQCLTINDEVHQALETLDNAILEVSADTADTDPDDNQHRGHLVVVAIDFGTTYSGYAFSFTRDPSNVYMMRKWEGGDPGVINEKTPTSILLTPDGQFHSFGYSARDNYHDLDKEEAKTWMYFDKFKMILHNTPDLCKDTLLTSSSGGLFPALSVFALALRYFRDHALQELGDQSGMKILNEDIRWVISVPAIWRASAKQFIRQAAYEGGLASPQYPDQLVIALEPEAASIYCRKLKMYQLVPEVIVERPLQLPNVAPVEPMNMNPACEDLKEGISKVNVGELVEGSRYMVVDCGGGTVDITVHQVDKGEKLIELYRASGGPYGSVGIDLEFEHVLDGIFGKDLMKRYREKCPTGWVDLMIAFESRKRSASPQKSSPLNVSLPFSFIDYCKKHKSGSIEHAIKKYGDKDIQWSRLGMLRFAPEAMIRLFIPTMDRIKQAIGDVLNDRGTRDLQYMFLVGGFAESAILQQEIMKEFGSFFKVIIPQGVGLAILKGSVLFGLDPTIVHVRKSRLTYGVGVLNKFRADVHPVEKKIVKRDTEWCTDVLDKYVVKNQPVALGDVILRSYKPANENQKEIRINIYFTDNPDSKFITDDGVQKCGVLSLDLEETSSKISRREIQTRMVFGETEIGVSALDVSTGRRVQASIDFLSN